MERKLTEKEMVTLLVEVASNLNKAGFNDSVGRLFLQIIEDLLAPVPQEEVIFLNEWCERLERTDVGANPMEMFDLVSDLSQIAKRFVVSKVPTDCENSSDEPTLTGDCENVA